MQDLGLRAQNLGSRFKGARPRLPLGPRPQHRGVSVDGPQSEKRHGGFSYPPPAEDLNPNYFLLRILRRLSESLNVIRPL